MFDVFFPFANYVSTSVKSTDAGYEVKVSLPGVPPENVGVEVNAGSLVLTLVKKKKEYSLEGYGIDADKVTATLKHGLLTINLPRAAKASLRKVSIE